MNKTHRTTKKIIFVLTTKEWDVTSLVMACLMLVFVVVWFLKCSCLVIKLNVTVCLSGKCWHDSTMWLCILHKGVRVYWNHISAWLYMFVFLKQTPCLWTHQNVLQKEALRNAEISLSQGAVVSLPLPTKLCKFLRL